MQSENFSFFSPYFNYISFFPAREGALFRGKVSYPKKVLLIIVIDSVDNVDNVEKIAVSPEIQKNSLMWTARLFYVDKQWTINVDKCKTSLIEVNIMNKNTKNINI